MATRPLGHSTVHPADEILERYSMRRLADEEQDAVEEHLLFCETCRSRLEQADTWVALVRAAIQEVEPEPAWEHPVRKPMQSELAVRPLGMLRAWFSNFVEALTRPIPQRVLATSLALAGIAVFAPLVHEKPLPEPVRVPVRAMRGSETLVHTAPAGTPLRVMLDAPTAEGAIFAQVVDPDGKMVSRSRLVAEDTDSKEHPGAYASFPEGIVPGNYWLRLEGHDHTALKELRLVIR